MSDPFDQARSDGYLAVVGREVSREAEWEGRCLREHRPFVLLRTSGVTAEVRYRLETATGDRWSPDFNDAISQWLAVQSWLLVQGSPSKKAEASFNATRGSAYYIAPDAARVFAEALVLLLSSPAHYAEETLNFDPTPSLHYEVPFEWVSELRKKLTYPFKAIR